MKLRGLSLSRQMISGATSRSGWLPGKAENANENRRKANNLLAFALILVLASALRFVVIATTHIGQSGTELTPGLTKFTV